MLISQPNWTFATELVPWRVAEELMECTCGFAPKGSSDACDDLRFVGPKGSLKMKDKLLDSSLITFLPLNVN